MLNRSKPYAEVWGMPGVRYEQDGRQYRPDGTPVDAPRPPAATPIEPGAADTDDKPVTIDGATESDRTGELSRAEIMAELRRRKVKFAATKSTPVLQAILDDAIATEGQA